MSEEGRWTVGVDGSGETVVVWPANLTPSSEDAADEWQERAALAAERAEKHESTKARWRASAQGVVHSPLSNGIRLSNGSPEGWLEGWLARCGRCCLLLRSAAQPQAATAAANLTAATPMPGTAAKASLLMEEGHHANRKGDYKEAHCLFTCANELAPWAAARLSAANMALK